MKKILFVVGLAIAMASFSGMVFSIKCLADDYSFEIVSYAHQDDAAEDMYDLELDDVETIMDKCSSIFREVFQEKAWWDDYKNPCMCLDFCSSQRLDRLEAIMCSDLSPDLADFCEQDHNSKNIIRNSR